MELENLTNGLVNFSPELIEKFGTLITVLEAVGWMVFFYLVFNIINMIINRNKKKQLEQLTKDVGEIKKILKKK